MTGPFFSIALIVLMGGNSQRVCGFGSGIFATLVYSAYLPVPQAAAVTSIINVFLTLPLALRYRRYLTPRKIIVPFLVYSVSSLLIIRASLDLDGALLKRIFGGFLLLLCLYHFTLSGKQVRRWTPWMAAGTFIISGLGSGLFAVGGPLMVLYFLAHTDSHEEFLADTQMIFTINTAPTLVLRLSSDLLNAGHIRYLVPGLFGTVIGFILAGRIVGHISKERLTKIVYIAVGLSGMLYLLGF